MSDKQKHLLLISQVYLPDPAAVGQYMADVAEEMSRKGWKVTVLTAERGYDDPSRVFPRSETLNGVNVRRIPFSSFGKKTIAHRLFGQALFCLQAAFRGLFCGKLDSILVTTSPPIGGMVGWFISILRRTPFHFWIMDLNPDQAIAQGIINENSIPAKAFHFLNRRLLKRAASIIVLDEFMAKNVLRKLAGLEEKMHVIPPWPMDDALELIPRDQNPFIKEHGLSGKFILMYSGNHSPVHPLRTFLEAAQILAKDSRILFLFVGGGKGKAEVEEFIQAQNPTNVISLPYQPLERIRYSLSAADIHLVSMGGPMIGCVHPCKFYGSLALAKPLLYLGPSQSHIGQTIEETSAGWQINHGDTDALVAMIQDALVNPNLQEIGARGRRKIVSDLSRDILCSRFCRIISSLPLT